MRNAMGFIPENLAEDINIRNILSEYGFLSLNNIINKDTFNKSDSLSTLMHLYGGDMPHFEFSLDTKRVIVEESKFNHIQKIRMHHSKFNQPTDIHEFDTVYKIMKKYLSKEATDGFKPGDDLNNMDINLQHYELLLSTGYLPYAIMDWNTLEVFEIDPHSDLIAQIKLIKQHYEDNPFKNINHIFNTFHLMFAPTSKAEQSELDASFTQSLLEQITNIINHASNRTLECQILIWQYVLNCVNDKNTIYDNFDVKSILRKIFLYGHQQLESSSKRFNALLLEVLNQSTVNKDNDFELDLSKYSSSDTILLYRGVKSGFELGKQALSWTDDKQTAEMFAQRFSFGKPGHIYSMQVKYQDILAAYQASSEHEYILDPKFVLKCNKRGKIHNELVK